MTATSIEWTDVTWNPTTGCDRISTGIDWVIVGGESGPHCRPIELSWARDLRDRRGAAAFFFTQVGGRTPKAGGRVLDGRIWA